MTTKTTITRCTLYVNLLLRYAQLFIPAAFVNNCGITRKMNKMFQFWVETVRETLQFVPLKFARDRSIITPLFLMLKKGYFLVYKHLELEPSLLIVRVSGFYSSKAGIFTQILKKKMSYDQLEPSQVFFFVKNHRVFIYNN